MEDKTKVGAGSAEPKSSVEEVKRLLADCDQLHQQAKFEESLQLANSAKANNAPTDLLPYVLEMQIRNMYDLMMYQAALKLLDQILKYMPLVKDFQFRKIQCELALAKTDEAKAGLEKMKKSIADEFEERRQKGDPVSQQDQQWQQKVEGLLARLAARKNRDLNKIRVYFKEATGNKLGVDAYLEKSRNYYAFEETPDSVTVQVKALVKQGATPTVDFKPQQLKVSFTNQKDNLFSMDVDLFAEVDPRLSNFEVSAEGQLTIHLHKKQARLWHFLEEQLSAKQEGANKANLTHTTKSWAQICAEFEEDLDRNKLGDGDPAMQMFKQIYANGSDEQKQAMVRSYLTSGGTVLSTNLDEVKTKDYSGKDRPSAPDGQEWRKWEY